MSDLITQGWGIGLMVTVPTPQFPFVPLALGVPQLARSLLFPPPGPPTIGTPATSGALWQSTQAAPVWGVFDANNVAVITPDSVIDFGWRQEYRVSNFPVQQGQFASYNKVRLPFETSVTMTKGGTLAERTGFEQQIDDLVASLELYTILTPEKSYFNCNVMRAEITRRGASGAYFIDAELFFTEVVDVQAQYSSTSPITTPTADASVPSAVPSVNQGLNNPSVPSTAVQQQADASLYPQQ